MSDTVDSDFCNFFPENAECQIEPEPEQAGGSGADEGEGGVKLDHGEYNPLMGNLVYLAVTFFSTYEAYFKLFRFHNDSDYSDGEIMGTNLWLYSTKVQLYTNFTVMFALLGTQLGSMLGYSEINLQAWAYLGIAEVVISALVYMVRLYIWNRGYNISQSADESVAA